MTSCESVPENDDDSFIILRTSPGPSSVSEDPCDCKERGDVLLNISPGSSVLQQPQPPLPLNMSTLSLEVEEENRVLRECVRRQRDVARDTLRAIDNWRAAVTHTATATSTHVHDENKQLRQEIKQLKEDVALLQRCVMSPNEQMTSQSGASEREGEGGKETERSQIEWVTSPEDDVVDKLGAQLALVEGQRRQLVVEVEQLSWQKECLERVADGVTQDRSRLQDDVTRLQDYVTKLQDDIARRQEEIELMDKLWRSRETDWTVQGTEWMKQELEWKNKEAEWKKREVEWKKQESELKKKEAELTNPEMEYEKKEAEIKNQEIEYKKKEVEWKNREVEWKKQEAELNKKGTEFKNQEIEYKKKEAEWKSREVEWKKREAEWMKQESQWKKRESDMKTQESDLRKQISEISTGPKAAKVQDGELQTLTRLLLQRLESSDCSGAVPENTELGHLRDKLTALFAGSNDSGVCALSAALVARGEELEGARIEVARLNDHIQLLQHQLDLYKSDFEEERAARQEMAGKLDRLTAQGEASAPPPKPSTSAPKDTSMSFQCPLCVSYFTSTYLDLEAHLVTCMQD